MIIAISGTQGQGKTFILKHLEDIGYNVLYNTTARDTLNIMDMTLTEVYSMPDAAQEFQNKILETQSKINIKHANSDTILFTERSFADIFTYAMFALGNINTYDKWLAEYYEKCVTLQKQYNSIIFLSGREFIPEDDGVRSTNAEFGKCVDIIAEHYASNMSKKSGVPYNHISLPEVNDRISSIQRIIGDIK